jgi:hypothetical protein
MNDGSIKHIIRLTRRTIRSLYNSGLNWADKLYPDCKTDTGGGKKVLIATSVAGHLASLNLEGVVGKALQVRGASVSALLCDGVLPACMDCEYRFFPTNSSKNNLIKNGPSLLCLTCTRVGKKLYNKLGIDISYYSGYLTAEERENAKVIAQNTEFSEIKEYDLEGLQVGEHAYAGALRFFARGEIEGEPFSEELVRAYFEAALITTYVMRNLLTQENIDVCVFNHGIYVPQGLIGEVCREKGVRVVNWNPAYRKGCFIFSHHDTYHHTLMYEPVENWVGMSWNVNIENKLLNYLKSRWEGSQDWIWFHENPEFDLDAIQKKTGIDLKKPTIGMLTNVVWDAQLHYPANAFNGMIEWIRETIEYFINRPDLQLVIRVHPAEIRGTVPSRQRVVDEINRHFPSLPPHIIIIHPENNTSTYALMMQCDSVIIYGTKTGVELTSVGVPVIVAGEAWIRNKGVTIDATSKEQYFKILSRLPIGKPMENIQVERARKYAFHFFFRRMIPLPFMKPRKGWPTFKPDITSFDELRSGKHPGLDVICNGILEGSEFIYRAEAEEGKVN